MNKFYVYTHWHHETGYPVCFYVGKGHGKRAWSTQRRGKFWCNTVAKYGCTVVINATGLTEEESFTLERSLIKSIGRRNIGTGTLVNLTDGGDGCVGLRHTPESRARISQVLTNRPCSAATREKLAASRRGKPIPAAVRAQISTTKRNPSAETRENIAAARRGKKASPQTIERMSAALKGIPKSPEHRAKISAAKRRNDALRMNAAAK